MMKGQQVEWTQAQTERLRTLRLTDGLSSRQIACLFGCTKNAIAGKIHRLGLNRVRVEATAKTSPSRDVRTGRNRAFSFGNEPVSKQEQRSQPIESEGAFMPVFAPAKALLLSLVDLEVHHCRWPFDTVEGTRFCGRNANGQSSYCEAHRKLSSLEPGRARQ